VVPTEHVGHARAMDPRTSAAVAASVQWYDDVFASYGIPVTRVDGLWVAGAEPPRWHSAVKTIEPGVPQDAVLKATGRFPHGSVADSFGELDLEPSGFTLLIDATWLHLPGSPAAGLPDGWHVVEDPAALASWNLANDTVVPAHPRITVLGRYDRDRLVAGVALNDCAQAVGVSNTWHVTWADVVSVAAAVHPGRDLAMYAAGAERDAALAHGFAPVGPQHVWVR
jgi:hypothetical protein